MLYVLLDENLHRPRVYRRGTPTVSPSLCDFIKDYSPKTVEAICGIPECLIVEAALIFGKSAKRAVALEHGGQPKHVSACTRTTRFIICIWPPAKSASPAAGRSRSPDSPTPWAAEKSAAWRICCPAIASVENDAQRGEVERFWRRPFGRIAAKAGLPALEQFEALAARQAESDLDSLHQSGGVGAGSRLDRESAAPSRAGYRPGRLSPDRHESLGSCAPAGGPVERKRRRHDQLRTACHLHAEACRPAR